MHRNRVAVDTAGIMEVLSLGGDLKVLEQKIRLAQEEVSEVAETTRRIPNSTLIATVVEILRREMSIGAEAERTNQKLWGLGLGMDELSVRRESRERQHTVVDCLELVTDVEGEG